MDEQDIERAVFDATRPLREQVELLSDSLAEITETIDDIAAALGWLVKRAKDADERSKSE